MRIAFAVIPLLILAVVFAVADRAPSVQAQSGQEWQLTSTTINHALDNNDNFSMDDKYLAVDTRETYGGGIGNGTMILKVDVDTGVETLVYAPQPFIVDPVNMAPGLGAASFSPVADEIIMIHGPLVSETPTLGFYGTRNRRGGVVPGAGVNTNTVRFVDYRDVTSTVTIPGAHRGGTHRHEYTLDGKRIGYTYDDFLMQQIPRTIGMMVPHAKAPTGVSHYCVLLVTTVPAGTSKPGELEQASDDSWVGAKGLMRGFIGRVKQPDGSLMSSLYVVDIPENVDVTTAYSGSMTEFMRPPQGTVVRRLTNTTAGGIVRGSHDGTRVAYFATAVDGSRQVFVINSQGSDQSPDPAMRPMQASFLEKGASAGVRWHPSGNSVAVISDNGIAAICVQPGPFFGASYWLSQRGGSVPAEALVWSRNGKLLAYNRRVPTYDASGKLVKDFNGNDFRQIFMVNFPDANNNGIADPIEEGVVRNGASFAIGKTAPEAWASLFGTNWATGTFAPTTPTLPTNLGGVSVEVTDSAGVKRPSLLSLVSPQQINFVVPAGSKTGAGTVTVTKSGGQKVILPVQIDPVAPGLFSANGSGAGVAAAVAVRITAQGQQTSQLIYTCTGGAGTCTATPISLGADSDQVILLLFGTGVRGASKVTATIGGQACDVLGFAAQSEYPGLDQINVRIARSLAGKGEVPVALTVDGKLANTVTVSVQ